MTATYKLNVNDLSQEVLNSIREAFKGKLVEITVTEVTDETEYLLSSKTNVEHLQRSEQLLKDGKGISFSVQELEEKYGKE